jgi:alpha-ribazole phosphatase
MSGQILLLRHSLTEANEKKLYCGKTDLPLSPRGLALARERARKGWFRAVDFDAFFSSGMRRTDETLRIFFGNVAFTSLPALRELDFGDFELLSYEALRDRADYQRWISGDERKNRCPGGESAEDMEQRCLPAFAELLKCERAAVVTHGGVIAAIMAQYFPQEGKNRYEWQPEPAGAYLLRTERGRPTGYQRL